MTPGVTQLTVLDGLGQKQTFNFVQDSSGRINDMATPTDTTGNPYSKSNPIPTGKPTASLTSHSGSITTGGSSQQIVAADSTRNGYMFQNTSSGDLWLNEIGANAVIGGDSILVPAGQMYEPIVVSLTAVTVIGATTGQTFTFRSW